MRKCKLLTLITFNIILTWNLFSEDNTIVCPDSSESEKVELKSVTHANYKEPKLPFTIGPEAFDPNGGHIQGIAASKDAVYITQQTQIAKVDWTGKLLKRMKVQIHTGDVAYHDGKLFTSISVEPELKEGKIQVFDPDLNLLQETSVNRTLNGIAYLDGILYVGMGAKEEPSRDPHRINILGRFDAETLKEIPPRIEFDYGYKTQYGAQNITTDGKLLYASFYAVGSSPKIVVFDKELKIIGTHHFPANQGLEVMPTSLTDGKIKFINSTTKNIRNPNAVTCIIEILELKYKPVEPLK